MYETREDLCAIRAFEFLKDATDLHSQISSGVN